MGPRGWDPITPLPLLLGYSNPNPTTRSPRSGPCSGSTWSVAAASALGLGIPAKFRFNNSSNNSHSFVLEPHTHNRGFERFRCQCCDATKPKLLVLRTLALEPTGTLVETTLERRGAEGLGALTSPEKSEATRVLRRQLSSAAVAVGARAVETEDDRGGRRERTWRTRRSRSRARRGPKIIGENSSRKKTDQCEGDRVEDLHSLSLDSKAAPLARIITPI